MPFCIPLICTSLILPSNSTFVLNMLPYDSLFHVFILDLRSLIFCWNWYIYIPLMVGISSHHSFSFSENSSWRSQIFSKRNNLQRITPALSHSILIGQWPDSTDGSTMTLSSPPFIIIYYDTIKRSI